MVDHGADLHRVAALHNGEIVDSRKCVRDDVAHPVRVSKRVDRIHPIATPARPEVSHSPGTQVAQVSVGNTEDVVPVLGHGSIASVNSRAVVPEAGFIHGGGAKVMLTR